jgi:hypothetical protein
LLLALTNIQPKARKWARIEKKSRHINKPKKIIKKLQTNIKQKKK